MYTTLWLEVLDLLDLVSDSVHSSCILHSEQMDHDVLFSEKDSLWESSALSQ